MARQFVVQLENRPGELAHLARALAARGIDLRHIGGVGAGDLGCAFITTSDDVGDPRGPARPRPRLTSRGPRFSSRCGTSRAAWPMRRNASRRPA